MDALALARLRCHHFGFIFQRYHLLPHLDAAANVEIPAVYAGTSRPDRQARARQLLVSALESASVFPKISSSHLKSITSSLDFHYDHSRTC